MSYLDTNQRKYINYINSLNCQNSHKFYIRTLIHGKLNDIDIYSFF